MSTAKALRSIRRLLAFACVLLSLVVVGVGLTAHAVDRYSGGAYVVGTGVLLGLISAIWFLLLLAAPAPTGGGESDDVDADGGDGDDAAADDDRSADANATARYGPW